MSARLQKKGGIRQVFIPERVDSLNRNSERIPRSLLRG